MQAKSLSSQIRIQGRLIVELTGSDPEIHAHRSSIGHQIIKQKVFVWENVNDHLLSGRLDLQKEV